MSDHTARRALIARWLQSPNDPLLYDPDNTIRASATQSEALPDYYILAGHTPIPASDVYAAVSWQGTAPHAQWQIGDTYVTESIRVNTAFSCINFSDNNRCPLLFATIVFGGPPGVEDVRRYATWEQAEVGHAAVCAALQAVIIAQQEDRLGVTPHRLPATRRWTRWLRRARFLIRSKKPYEPA